MPRPRKDLSGQLSQAHFMAIEYYMRGYSKKESLIRAGYSETTADKAAWKIFGREDVQREIERRRYKIKSRNHDIIDRIQEELANIAFFNIGHFIEVDEDGNFVYDFQDATMEDFAAIGSVEVEEFVEGRGKSARTVRRVKVKPYDKKAALDSLARIHGLFQDNVNLTAGEGKSLEERLHAGRARVAAKKLNDGKTIEGEAERVDDVQDSSKT